MLAVLILIMSKPLDLARPVMGGGASLYPNQEGRQRGEEANDLTTPEALAAGHLTLSVNRMNVKCVLRDIRANCHASIMIAPVRYRYRQHSAGAEGAGPLPHQRSAAGRAVERDVVHVTGTSPLHTWMLAGRLQRHTTTLPARMEDPVRVRDDLPPGPGSGAALCQRLRASPVAATAQPGKSNGTGDSGLDKTWSKPTEPRKSLLIGRFPRQPPLWPSSAFFCR